MSGPKKEPRKACNDRLQPAERPRPLPRAVRNPLAVRRFLPVRVRAARALYGARLARTGQTPAPAPTAGPGRGGRGRGQHGRRRGIHPQKTSVRIEERCRFRKPGFSLTFGDSRRRASFWKGARSRRRHNAHTAGDPLVEVTPTRPIRPDQLKGRDRSPQNISDSAQDGINR